MTNISNQNEVNNLKCYNCGKTFKTTQHLTQHKNRKTPCLIREVAPGDIQNPNRCIYCNKIFAKNSNLKRHLGTCKIKNGGMELLVDKIQYEQEIRILKEKDRQKDEEIREMKEQINQLMKCQNNTNNTNNTNINITNNNITNNIDNKTINFNFYNCDNPRMDTVKFTQNDFIGIGNIYEMLIRKIYFNQEIPENHVIYLPNIKDRKRALIYKNDSWTMFIGENLDRELTLIKDTTHKVSAPKLNFKGDLYVDESDYIKLNPITQKSIYDFNTCKDYDDFPVDKIVEIATEKRNLVKSTREKINI